MRYLLDTNICIYLIKKRPTEVLERFRQHSPKDVAISTIEAANIRAQLEKNGMLIGPYDLLISGLARSQGMTLVTNNTREFERIAELRLENWVE
jgi:tRNA(fMet)-specific endonuclease VapC